MAWGEEEHRLEELPLDCWERAISIQTNASARNRGVLGTMPSSSVAILLNAATERSMELAFSQVGQSSLMVTVTDLPFLVLVR